MTLALALAIVLIGSTLVLVYQWATGMLGDPLDAPPSDEWWPKGPRHDA